MSEKEFEEIYRKEKEEETPDLWDRIEAELDKETSQKKNIKKWIISFSTLAAAVLIFFIASPLFHMIKENQTGAGEKNAGEVQELSDNISNLSEEKTEEVDNNVDKENTSKDFVVNEEEEMSPDTNGEVSVIENENTSDINIHNDFNKVISGLKKSGIVLSEVDRDKVGKLEVIKAEKLPAELKNVIGELKKLEEEQTYFMDLNDVYYVEIGELIYKISS